MAKSKTDKPPPVAVAIIDTHCLLREAIAAWMEQQGGFRVAWMGATYKALDAAMDDGLKVSLVLVALGMGEDDGFASLARLQDERPGLFRAAYVHRHDEASLMRAYRCGAQALLHDTVEGRAVLSMLEVVLVGGVVHTPLTQGLLLENPDGLTQEERNRAGMLKQLTQRQLEVVEALVNFPDHTVEKLGRHLGITYNTLDSHLKRLYELFGLRSRPALVVAVLRLGLVQI